MQKLLQALLPASIKIQEKSTVSECNGTSLSMQIRGRQFCVNRNYTIKPPVDKEGGGPCRRSYSKFIYAIPITVKNLNDVPENDYHRSIKDPEVDPITNAEYGKVKVRFGNLQKKLRRVVAREFLGEAKGYREPNFSGELIDPDKLDLCSLAELLHFMAEVIDEAELGESRPLLIVEVEQILQALKRVKRRLEFVGIREKDIDVNLFSAFDSKFLLEKGKSVYKKRQLSDIERERRTEPEKHDSI